MIEVIHKIVYGEFTAQINKYLKDGWEIENNYAHYNQATRIWEILYVLKREVKR